MAHKILPIYKFKWVIYIAITHTKFMVRISMKFSPACNYKYYFSVVLVHMQYKASSSFSQMQAMHPSLFLSWNISGCQIVG